MPRRAFSAKVAWNDIYDYIAYVEMSLSLRADKGDKELAALVPPVKKLRTRWEAMDGERRRLLTNVIRANALVSLQNQELDGLTTSLHNDTLAAADQKTQGAAVYATVSQGAVEGGAHGAGGAAQGKSGAHAQGVAGGDSGGDS